MDRNTILFIVLSAGFLLLWLAIFPPQPGRKPADIPAIDPSAQASPGPEAPSPAGAADPGGGNAAPRLAGIGPAPAAAARPVVPRGRGIAAEAEEEVVIDTPLVAVRLTNRGGRVTSWRLRKYLDDTGQPLDLVSRAGRSLDRLPLQFILPEAEASDRLNKGLYRVSRAEREEDGHPVTEITLSWSDGAGWAATKVLRLPHDSYLATFRFAAEADGRPIEPALVWGAGFGAHNGRESGQYADMSTAVVDIPGLKKPQKRVQSGIKAGEPWLLEERIAWTGIEDKYFAALFVPPAPAAGRVRFEILPLVEEGVQQTHLTMTLDLHDVSEVGLFVGPKDYDLLKALGHGLDRLLDFGFFGVIALPLFYSLQFLRRHTGNYGWAIVILTVVIRLLFFPLLYSGQLKMRVMQEKMKRVQPKVKSMKERYHRLEKKEVERGNAGARQKLRQQMNEEMMGLYREENINPLGSMSGCLPLLLQLPILYAFYSILSISIELRRAPFILWIQDLSQRDPYYVTPIIMGATQLVQQVMTSSSIPDPAQRRMMYLMPIMFTWIFLNFPSGLVLYWLVNNLLGIAQQYLINRRAENDKAAA